MMLARWKDCKWVLYLEKLTSQIRGFRYPLWCPKIQVSSFQFSSKVVSTNWCNFTVIGQRNRICSRPARSPQKEHVFQFVLSGIFLCAFLSFFFVKITFKVKDRTENVLARSAMVQLQGNMHHHSIFNPFLNKSLCVFVCKNIATKGDIGAKRQTMGMKSWFGTCTQLHLQKHTASCKAHCIYIYTKKPSVRPTKGPLLGPSCSFCLCTVHIGLSVTQNDLQARQPFDHFCPVVVGFFDQGMPNDDPWFKGPKKWQDAHA